MNRATTTRDLENALLALAVVRVVVILIALGTIISGVVAIDDVARNAWERTTLAAPIHVTVGPTGELAFGVQAVAAGAVTLLGIWRSRLAVAAFGLAGIAVWSAVYPASILIAANASHTIMFPAVVWFTTLAVTGVLAGGALLGWNRTRNGGAL